MKRLVLLFSGQGSQYPGMGKRLYDSSPKARQVYEEASDILGKDMKRLCFEGDRRELSQTENTQIALYTTCMAMYYSFKQEFDLVPTYVAGHSLGEYAALTSAGVVNFQDGLKIVSARAKIMQEAIIQSKGIMSVILGLSSGQIEEVCEKYKDQVVISNYNSPRQFVISGYRKAVEEVSAKLELIGGSVIPLDVKAPFHSFLMFGAAKEFMNELKKYTFNRMNIPVISNISGLPYEKSQDIQELLAKQIIEPVQWKLTMDYFHKNHIDTLIEIGPQSILKNLAKENYSTFKAFSYDNKDDMDILVNTLNPNSIRDSKLAYLFIEKCVSAVVCTRNRNWNNEEYQEGVVLPYKKVKEQFYKLKDTDTKPNKEQVEEAGKMLLHALNIKKVPLEEQKAIYREITNTTGFNVEELSLTVNK